MQAPHISPALSSNKPRPPSVKPSRHVARDGTWGRILRSLESLKPEEEEEGVLAAEEIAVAGCSSERPTVSLEVVQGLQGIVRALEAVEGTVVLPDRAAEAGMENGVAVPLLYMQGLVHAMLCKIQATLRACVDLSCLEDVDHTCSQPNGHAGGAGGSGAEFAGGEGCLSVGGFPDANRVQPAVEPRTLSPGGLQQLTLDITFLVMALDELMTDPALAVADDIRREALASFVWHKARSASLLEAEASATSHPEDEGASSGNDCDASINLASVILADSTFRSIASGDLDHLGVRRWRRAARADAVVL
jgi:hypothetical protein